MHARRTLLSVPRFLVFMLGITPFWATPAWTTDVAGNCPPGGFTAAGSPWNFTGAVSVPSATICTVEAGATLNGNGLQLGVAGTLNAVGTSNANRDVVFNNVRVFFVSGAAGVLQFCTVNNTAPPTDAIGLNGAQTVTGCTIAGAATGIGVFGGVPTISDNLITAQVGLDVVDGSPTIDGNTITATLIGIDYRSGTGGGGTASGNTIGFGGSGSNRTGIAVRGSGAAPTIDGNIILDDQEQSDAAIRVTAATAVEIVNNTLTVTGGDRPIEINPASLFAPSTVVAGNSFPMGLASGITLTGLVSGTVTVESVEPATGMVVDTYVVQGLGVAAGATLTITPGITLTADSLTVTSLGVSGTFNAVGTSSANRDVVFNNVRVVFLSGATGTLQFCTANITGAFSALNLQGLQTVTDCTITSTGTGVGVSSGAPAISDNLITAQVGLDVADGSPTISGNTITTTLVGIDYRSGTGGGGTASGNTISFDGSGSNRTGISVRGSGAAPTIDGNTILDDPKTSDTGILVVQGTGNAMTQILNNIICATGGDTFISVPAGFTGTVAGNLNQCPEPTATETPPHTAAPTSTPTQTATFTSTTTATGGTATPTPTPTLTQLVTVTATPALLRIDGTCLVPGAEGLEPCEAEIPITAFLCSDASCETVEEVGRTATDDEGTFMIGVVDPEAAGARLIVAGELEGGGTGAGEGTTTTTYRVLVFGPIAGGRLAVEIGPVGEAALQLLEGNGIANYSDSRALGVNDSVADANAATSFAGDTVASAVGRARDTASADPIVQARLACPTDCDLNRTVTAAELVTAVNRALGHASQGVCEAADGNGDSVVLIDEMIEGVSVAIDECFAN